MDNSNMWTDIEKKLEHGVFIALAESAMDASGFIDSNKLKKVLLDSIANTHSWDEQESQCELCSEANMEHHHWENNEPQLRYIPNASS